MTDDLKGRLQKHDWRHLTARIEQLEAQVDTLQTAMTAPTQDEIDIRSKLASSQVEAMAAHAEVIRTQDEIGKLLHHAEAQLAEEKAKHALTIQQSDHFSAQLDTAADLAKDRNLQLAALQTQLAAAREALDDSQSLLVMIDHIGADSSMWIREDLRDLLTGQIIENRAALATAPATDGEKK